MDNRVIRPYEQGDEVRLGWLETNAVSVSSTLLEISGFFDVSGDQKVFDGREIVRARDARQIVFYPPRDRNLVSEYDFLMRLLHKIKTWMNNAENEMSKLTAEMEEIGKDEGLDRDEKDSAKRMRQAALDSCRRDLERITRSHTNINWNFNSLIEKLASNTVETVINEHSSRKYETIERVAERIQRYEED
jgi:hypothetical protein